jgi:hypothetical protein
MVERPRSKPRFLSAPRSRVYPHVGFSREPSPGPQRSATTPLVLRGNALAVPPEDGLRRRERRHLAEQSSPQRLSRFGEKRSLRVREAKAPATEARTEHAVLGPQELDRLALSATKPAGDQQNKELKRG